MKNTLVRGFVLALAVVGFTASSVAASHSGSKNMAKVGSAPKISGSFPACLATLPPAASTRLSFQTGGTKISISWDGRSRRRG